MCNSYCTWWCTAAIVHGDVQQLLYMVMCNSYCTWWCATAIVHGDVQQLLYMVMYSSYCTWWCATAIVHGDVQQLLYMVMYSSYCTWWCSAAIVHSYSTTTKGDLFLKLFILVKHSTCFGRSFRPSSGAQDCTYSNRRMSNSCCYLLLAAGMYGIMNIYKYGTPWFIRVWFCNGRSSPWWTRVYHTCRHILYRTCTCYSSLPEDDPSGSKHVPVEDIVKN